MNAEHPRTSVREGRENYAKDAKGMHYFFNVFFCVLRGTFAPFAYGSPILNLSFTSEETP